MVVEQAPVFAGRLLARQQVGARQAHIGIGNGSLVEIRGRHGEAGNGGGLKVPRGEVTLGQRFDVGGRFAEGIPISGVVGDAFAQVVEQDSQFAEILRPHDQQMDTRPVEVRLRGRRAGGDVDAADLQSGEEFHQPVFERRRHAIGVGVEQQAGEFAEDRRRDGALVGEDDGIAVAAQGDRRRRSPAMGVFEDENADGLGRFEVLLAHDFAEGMAEFLEADHSLLAGFFPGVGEDFEGAGGIADPAVGRQQGRGEAKTAKEKRAPHAIFIMARFAGGQSAGSFGRIKAPRDANRLTVRIESSQGLNTSSIPVSATNS